MPTVVRVDGFRVSILFAPREHGPAHVHVWCGSGTVRVWLDSLATDNNTGLSRAEVRRVKQIVADHGEFLLSEWERLWQLAKESR